MDAIENNSYNDEEEISLIDLFAVLLRFRKMIIFGTLIVTLLAGIFLFIVPALFPFADQGKVEVTYTVNLHRPGASIEKGLAGLGVDFNLMKSLGMSFYNPANIAREYKKYPFMSEEYPKENKEFNLFIKNLIDQEKFTLDIDKKTLRSYTNTNTNTFVTTLPEERLPIFESFLTDFLDQVSKSIDISGYIEILEAKTSDSIKTFEKDSSALLDVSTLQELRETYQDIQIYKNSKLPFYTLDPEPFIVSVAQGRIKKLIIVCLAAFFIFVFIAFVRNAVTNIKADPKAGKIISDAWESGK